MASSGGGSLLKRPFEGGFEATLGIFLVIYYHALVPGAKLVKRSCTIFSTRRTHTAKTGLVGEQIHTHIIELV